MKRLSMILCFLFLGNLGFSRTIYLVKVKAANKFERTKVANLVHIDRIKKGYVTAVVNKAELKQLKKQFQGKLKVVDSYQTKNNKSHVHADEYEFPKKDVKYHTYAEVLTSLKNLAKDHPKTVKVFNIGKSIEDRELLGVKITAGGFADEMKKPAMFLVGTHHAREHLSTEIPLLLSKYYADRIKTQPEFANFMKNRVIYILPLLNPDGALHDIKGRKYKMWRKNRRENEGSRYIGVDLNRNYDFRWGQGGSSKNPSSDVYMGKAPFSEPETQAIKRFVENHKNIKTMISFHTYSELILYPWGGTYDPLPGQELKVFKKMAETMAQWNNYKPQQSSDLYVATGDTCDWAYGVHNIFCFTFELTPASRFGGGFYPGAKAIDPTFEENKKPVNYLLKYTDDPYKVLK